MRADMTRGWAALIQMLEAIPVWGFQEAICRVFMAILEVRPRGTDSAGGGAIGGADKFGDEVVKHHMARIEAVFSMSDVRSESFLFYPGAAMTRGRHASGCTPPIPSACCTDAMNYHCRVLVCSS